MELLAGEQLIFIISGCFAAMATFVAMAQAVLHLRNYHDPVQQRLILRLLIMIPVYAVDSWLGIFLKEYAIYLNTLRNCYEAFVIYNFFTYLMEICGGREELVAELTLLPPKVYRCHSSPCGWKGVSDSVMVAAGRRCGCFG